MTPDSVTLNKIHSSKKRIEKLLTQLFVELEALEGMSGMAYIETLTEVKMKIRKLQ